MEDGGWILRAMSIFGRITGKTFNRDPEGSACERLPAILPTTGHKQIDPQISQISTD